METYETYEMVLYAISYPFDVNLVVAEFKSEARFKMMLTQYHRATYPHKSLFSRALGIQNLNQTLLRYVRLSSQWTEPSQLIKPDGIFFLRQLGSAHVHRVAIVPAKERCAGPFELTKSRSLPPTIFLALYLSLQHNIGAQRRVLHDRDNTQTWEL